MNPRWMARRAASRNRPRLPRKLESAKHFRLWTPRLQDHRWDTTRFFADADANVADGFLSGIQSAEEKTRTLRQRLSTSAIGP